MHSEIATHILIFYLIFLPFIIGSRENSITDFVSNLKNYSNEEIKTFVAFNGSMNGYFSFTDSEMIFDLIEKIYPEIISINRNYLTYNNHSMYVIRITNIQNKNEQKPKMLITSLTHARELATLSVSLYTIFSLISNYYKNNLEYISLINNTEIILIPILNADSYYLIEEHFNKTGDFLLYRKNQRKSSTKCFTDSYNGVDINRNFDYYFNDSDGSSDYECAEDYRGPFPFSEPESQLEKTLIETESNIKIVMNFHSFGNFIFLEGNNEHSNSNSNQIYEKLTSLANLSKIPEGAKIGNASNLLHYKVTADSCQWITYVANIPCLTIELGSKKIPNSESETFFPNPKYVPFILEDFESLIHTSSKVINPRLTIKVINGSDIICQNNNSNDYCLKNNLKDFILVQFFLSNYGFSNLLKDQGEIIVNLNPDKVPIIDSKNISISNIESQTDHFKVKIPSILSFDNMSFEIALSHNEFTPQVIKIDHFEFPSLNLNKFSSFVNLSLETSHRNRISSFVNSTQESTVQDKSLYVLFGVIIIILLLSIIISLCYKIVLPFSNSRHLYPTDIIQENEIYQKGFENGKSDNSPNLT